MIRGKDKNNPVIIFVHGGPGTSEIPYAQKYQNLLEEKFTVVNYDQRASGKSYHFFEDYSNLTSDLLVEDLLAMTDYVSKHLGKEKVILVGHSYGTYIGMQAANKAPEKYEAYVGIGQMSDTVESEMDSLNYVIEQAQSAGNTDEVAYLNELTEKIKMAIHTLRGIMLQNMVELRDLLKIQMVIMWGCYLVMNITYLM